MEHREAELRVTEPRDGSADDPARFLRELRRLRDGAGLGHTDVAARAHYPCEVIRAAEAGPALPDLPVLSAYVKSCGGAVADWEERWRALTSSPALPLLSVRTAGCSEAATAGARVGSVSMAADGHNPAVVMAALSRVASGITAEPSSSPSASAASYASPVPAASVAPEASTAWDAPAGSAGSAGSADVLDAPSAWDAAMPAPAPEPGSVFTPLDRTAPPADSLDARSVWDAATPEPGSVFTPLDRTAPPADSLDVRSVWDAATPEPGSVFTPLDRTAPPAASPEPVIAPLPDAGAVPSAHSAPWGAGGSAPEAPASQAPPAPPRVPAARLSGHAAARRRTGPSKSSLIAAIVIVVCLIVLLVALFS